MRNVLRCETSTILAISLYLFRLSAVNHTLNTVKVEQPQLTHCIRYPTVEA